MEVKSKDSLPQRTQRKAKGITRQRAEVLLKKIGEACDELERLAEENPELIGCVTRGAEEHNDAYLRLKARLALADQAPRCRWVKQDGTACRSPQMKKHIYCFAHGQMMEARALALCLPAQEDANAIQIGIMRIQKALIEDTISTKKAGLLLYSMQLALQNVGIATHRHRLLNWLILLAWRNANRRLTPTFGPAIMIAYILIGLILSLDLMMCRTRS